MGLSRREVMARGVVAPVVMAAGVMAPAVMAPDVMAPDSTECDGTLTTTSSNLSPSSFQLSLDGVINEQRSVPVRRLHSAL
jgi:hypothetical protein